jgi:type IV secretory pathway protease TraF
LDRGFRSARDGEVFGVTAHALSGDLAAVMAAIPRYEDPVTAFVVHWWMISSPEDDAQLVNLAVWQMLLHECAKRGYLAVTTQYDEATLKDRFTSRFALFKTARACLQEHGLEHLIS